MITRIAPNRYSTIVAWVKIILPLVAIGVLSTLFLFSGRPDPADALIVSEIDVAELADEQRLGRPRFAGILEGGQALRFAAEEAAPLADATDLFTAETISARLTLEPGLEALLEAGGALIDMSNEIAELSGGVLVRRTDGMRLQTEQMRFGLAVLMVETPGPIAVEGPGLILDAGQMRVDASAQMHFTGGVRMLYQPQPGEERP
ncbi:MAG: hypothetical protein AAGA70_18690 [Pseudomonadota bacterium]